MNKNLLDQLVDLYAGRELGAEAEASLEALAAADLRLAQDIHSLRATVDALQASPDAEFTEESNQRILMKLYARGIDLQKRTPDPQPFQYLLPIQG